MPGRANTSIQTQAHRLVTNANTTALERCRSILSYGRRTSLRSFERVANAAALSAEGRTTVNVHSR